MARLFLCLLLLALGAPHARAQDAGGSLLSVTVGGAATFGADVVGRSREALVLVSFMSGWCGPCRLMRPQLEQTSRTAGVPLHIVYIDIENDAALTREHQVSTIPVTIAYRNGEATGWMVGNQPGSRIVDFLRNPSGR